MDQLDALYDAAIAGDVDARDKLEMEADKLDDDDQTILHVESQKGNTERVRFILRELAQKNLLGKLNFNEETALHLAISGGHTEVAETIIDAARQQLPVTSFQDFLRQPDEDNDTAIHLAVKKRSVSIVKLLVEADPTDKHTQNFQGKTPMYLAVEKGYNDIVELISTICTAPSLDGPHGSTLVRINNLDQVENPGGTLYKIMDRDALFDAAIAGDADAIARLQTKADIPNKNGETILDIESKAGNTERVRFILREFDNKNLFVTKLTSPSKPTALHLAIYGGHTEVAKLIIEAAGQHLPKTSFQAFLRQGDFFRTTALHAAVMKRNVAIVKLLVEADPTDIHTQNDRGSTPMYIAVEKGYNEIVELISRTCKSPSLDGPDGSTVVRVNNLDQVNSPGGTLYKIMDRDALFDAAIAGDADAIARLRTKADVPNKNGETILDIESKAGNIERVRFILREFDNKNLFFTKLTSPSKQSALHLAIYGGHTEVAKLIIEVAGQHLPQTSFEAFLRQGDFFRTTALHAAVMRRNVAIVKLLVEADPTHTHTQNFGGKTPMYMAVEKGYNEIVELISKNCKAPSLDGPHGSTALHAAVKNGNNSIEVVKVLIEATRCLPSSAPDNDITDSNAVTSFQSVSDNDNTGGGGGGGGGVGDDDDDDDDDDDFSDDDFSDDDSTDDHPISSFQAFLRRVDEDGNTALHIAVMQGNLATAKLLVESDPSDPGIQNKKGETPFYIAAEKGHADILKMICTTSTAAPFSLVGPGGRATALNAFIKNVDEANNEAKDVIELIIDQIKKHNIVASLDEIFYGTEEDGRTILEVAVEQNKVALVNLILDLQYSASKRKDGAFISLMPVIYKAEEKGYKNIVDLLTKRYNEESKLSKDYEDQVGLISAIRSGKTETVSNLLVESRLERLVTFVDKLGWTALHHAVYHECNPIIKCIAQAQKGIKSKFGYQGKVLKQFHVPPKIWDQNKILTPFHVAVQRGRTSTVIFLMQIWPSSSSTYTVVDKNGQNILHLAALQCKKEMIEGILKYCPEKHKKKFVNKQNKDGNTTLHLLIQRSCLVPEILRYEELDTSVKNKKNCTPSDMLYVQEQIINDQVKIKVALDHIQIDGKRNIFSSSVFLSRRREEKDVNFREEAQKMIDGMLALMKENTEAVAKCYADAIAGDPISRAALEMEADKPNEAGETILHVESKKGAIENVRFILSAFANKNLLVRLDNRKQTALYLAAHHGHTKVVEALLSAATRNLPPSSANDDSHNPVTPFQAYIRQANFPNQNTALRLAVLNNDVAIVKLLVEADPNYSHVQNNEGKTPIYIAAENGFKDVVKEICSTSKALFLDGPAGSTNALHALMQNLKQGEEDRDLIITAINAAKRWSLEEDALHVFNQTDGSGRTLLELAIHHNHVSAVELILREDPAYHDGHGSKNHGLLRLINQAMNNECSKDIVQLLSQTFEAGINPDFQGVLALIIAIQGRDADTTSKLLEEDNKHFLGFVDSEGWTLLHHDAYHQFDSMPSVLIEAQEKVGYRDGVATPFHVAAKLGYTSTLIRLMQLCRHSPLPYITFEENCRNILHLAAVQKQKEMVNGILRYCPEAHRDQVLRQKDTEGNTPLHCLVYNGCFIEDLIEDIAGDMTKNNEHWIPRDMLYSQYNIVDDQVQIKMALDDINTDKSWKLWPSTRNENTFSSSVLPSRRQEKDIMLSEREKSLMDVKNAKMKEDLERYKQGTNSQIVVSALITTITFTVGFTVPGGLHQSGEINEGSAILSKKAAFKLFMISDALALLLSICSLFIYFLENMSQDLDQVTRLHATTVGLNIASVMLTMFVFMTGTYVVLSQSLALTITICVIGSLFFVFAIVQLLGVVYDRHRERKNEGYKKEA